VVRAGALYYLVFSGGDKGLHRAQLVDGRMCGRKDRGFPPRPNCIFGDFFVAAR